MAERARATVFWPGISSSINQTREQCQTCWKISPSQPHLPPSQPIVPSSPFEAIYADYGQLEGHHYLIIFDHFSNWPEIVQISPSARNQGSAGLIRALQRLFATFGVPNKLSSDGGPEFKSSETMEFLRRWGVQHRMSSANHPRSNGRAEVAVKSMKRLLRDTITNTGTIDTNAFVRAILQFRNTPDSINKLSPAQIIFGRSLKDALPIKQRSQIFSNDDNLPAWKELWKQRQTTLENRALKLIETLNAHTRDLQPLTQGDTCRIQNQHGNHPTRWDKLELLLK